VKGVFPDDQATLKDSPLLSSLPHLSRSFKEAQI
jgi:hypothetical protein